MGCSGFMLIKMPIKGFRFCSSSFLPKLSLSKKERGFAFAKPLTWCGKRDLNPYVKDTRPSNVPVCRFQHCRISNARFIITTILYKVKGFSDFL